MNRLANISQKISKNIGIIIIVFSLIAYFSPQYFSWMTSYTTIFLAIAMFGMGTSIDTRDFKKIIKKRLHSRVRNVRVCVENSD